MSKENIVAEKTEDITKIRKAILKIYSCILVLGLLYCLWIKFTGMAIPCLYYITTGLNCPGCGISRMFISLLRLDFISAFYYNPVALCLFCMWNLIAVLLFIGKPDFIKSRLFLYTAFWISIILLVLFGVVRNLL